MDMKKTPETKMPQQRLIEKFQPSLLAVGLISAACVASVPSSLPVHAEDSDDSFFTHLHTSKAMANVTILPGRVGPVEIAIQLETADELPLTAKAVSVTLTNVPSGLMPQTVQAVRTSDDQWLAKMSTPLAGRWMLELGITLSDSDKVDVESPIIIK
jgi:hypothetical protein